VLNGDVGEEDGGGARDVPPCLVGERGGQRLLTECGRDHDRWLEDIERAWCW